MRITYLEVKSSISRVWSGRLRTLEDSALTSEAVAMGGSEISGFWAGIHVEIGVQRGAEIDVLHEFRCVYKCRLLDACQLHDTI